MALTEVDRTLLDRLFRREPGAWKEFVDRYASVFGQVIKHTAATRSVQLSDHDVDDLAAEIFLVVLQSDFDVLRRFRGESSLTTYLVVIARRIIVHEIIRRRMAEALGHVKTHGATMDQVQSHDSDPAARIDNRELVQHMLEGLADTEAAIVKLFHLEGRSYREISMGLGVPENSIGPTLTRAREKLRHSSLAGSA